MNRAIIIVAAVGILGTLVLSKYERSASPEARNLQRFKAEVPAAEIVEIDLEPAAVSSLTPARVAVTDRAQIEEFAQLLRGAQPIGLNHPESTWRAALRIRTTRGDFGGDLASTKNQGVILSFASGVTSGWYLGTVRQDGLAAWAQRAVESEKRGPSRPSP